MLTPILARAFPHARIPGKKLTMCEEMTDALKIRNDLRPGDLGRLIQLHGDVYEGEESQFGLTFEAHVARTVAEFVLDNDARGQVWLAEQGDELVGCVAMVDRGDRGQLRWVLVSPCMRGTGLGKKLVHGAIDYAADQSAWREVFLETTDGLTASMDIYRKLGFVVSHEKFERLWGEKEQRVIIMAKKLK